MSERMHFEELRRPRVEDQRRSFLEENFGLSTQGFERTSGLTIDEITRYEYRPSGGFRKIDKHGSRKSIEVMWSAEKSVLVVPPPVSSGKPVTIAELAVMTLPVVDFIRDQQPDIVIGCDRGARIYSFAVYSMWQAKNAERFPTLSGDLHYARLSKSLPLESLEGALGEIIAASHQEGERQDRNIKGDKPKLMFIDDWVSSGATRKYILEALKVLGVHKKVDVVFVVMCGEGADATGSTQRVNIPWHDDPNTVGVNYDSQGIGYAVLTEESKGIRNQVRHHVKRVAQAVKGNNLPVDKAN